MMINELIFRGHIHGIKKLDEVVIRNLLFVDDVLTCIMGNNKDCSFLKPSLDLLYRAIGMEINTNKSCIIYNGFSNQSILLVREICPFPINNLDEGFKYLGFYMKPNKCHISYWVWMVWTVEAQILVWCNCYLSRCVHLMLVKSMKYTGIRSMSFQKVSSNWSGRKTSTFFGLVVVFSKDIPLVKWSQLEAPKELGG